VPFQKNHLVQNKYIKYNKYNNEVQNKYQIFQQIRFDFANLFLLNRDDC